MVRLAWVMKNSRQALREDDGETGREIDAGGAHGTRVTDDEVVRADVTPRENDASWISARVADAAEPDRRSRSRSEELQSGDRFRRRAKTPRRAKGGRTTHESRLGDVCIVDAASDHSSRRPSQDGARSLKISGLVSEMYVERRVGTCIPILAL
jgi:hypothetical protein